MSSDSCYRNKTKSKDTVEDISALIFTQTPLSDGSEYGVHCAWVLLEAGESCNLSKVERPYTRLDTLISEIRC